MIFFMPIVITQIMSQTGERKKTPFIGIPWPAPPTPPPPDPEFTGGNYLQKGIPKFPISVFPPWQEGRTPDFCIYCSQRRRGIRNKEWGRVKRGKGLNKSNRELWKESRGGRVNAGAGSNPPAFTIASGLANLTRAGCASKGSPLPAWP